MPSRLEFITEEVNKVKEVKKEGITYDVLNDIDRYTKEQLDEVKKGSASKIAKTVILSDLYSAHINRIFNESIRDNRVILDYNKTFLLTKLIQLYAQSQHICGIEKIYYTTLNRRTIGEATITQNKQINDMINQYKGKENNKLEAELEKEVFGNPILCEKCKSIVTWEGLNGYMQFTQELRCNCGHNQRIR